MKNFIWKKILREYSVVIIGVLVASIGLDAFLIPNRIAAGGVSGLATIIYHLSGFPAGISIFIINIPLFIIGGRIVGKEFFLKTLVATIIMSVYIDLVPTPVLSNDLILSTVYGGALVGLGLGLTLYAGATSGGTDMAAKILHSKIPKISVSTFLFAIDFAVILIAAFVFNPEIALYAIASIYISAKLIDLILQGFKTGKAYFIITTNPDEIRDSVLDELDRGITIINAVGGYSGENRSVLLCVLRRNIEVIKLKSMVKDLDPNAFMIASNVTEVLGEGFSE